MTNPASSCRTPTHTSLYQAPQKNKVGRPGVADDKLQSLHSGSCRRCLATLQEAELRPCCVHCCCAFQDVVAVLCLRITNYFELICWRLWGDCSCNQRHLALRLDVGQIYGHACDHSLSTSKCRDPGGSENLIRRKPKWRIRELPHFFGQETESFWISICVLIHLSI